MANIGAVQSGNIEGNQVPESGPSRAEIASLTHRYKEVYQRCLQKIDALPDASVKELVTPLKQVMDDVWEQNQMLQDHCHDLEESAVQHMENMARRLDQTGTEEGPAAQKRMMNESDDTEALLKILKEWIVHGDVTLDDYEFHTINRDEVEKIVNEGKSLQRSLPIDNSGVKFSSPSVAGLEISNAATDGSLAEKEDPMDETEYLAFAEGVGSVKKDHDQPYSVGKRNDDALMNDQENEVENLKKDDKLINDKENGKESLKMDDELMNDQEYCDCDQESSSVSADEGFCTCDLGGTSNGEVLDPSLESTDVEMSKLKADLLKKERELTTVRESLKASETNLQESKWALAAEVAEKHDQILELRRVVASLEEKLRQADMQTHFKDDIIKKMRTELKTAKTSETKRLCDVVAELTERQRKMETGDGKFGNIQGALLDIVNNIEDALKSMPVEVARSEVERLTQIKRRLIHHQQLEPDVTDDGKVSRIVSSKDPVVGPLQDVINSLDDTIAVIKQNQKTISENGDWDCSGKLETLGKDIRVVESQLSQIAGLGESSSELENRNQQISDLTKLLNEILNALSVSTPSAEHPSLLDLKHRITILKDHLFNTCLPELRAQLATEQTMARNKEITMQNLQKMVQLREQQVINFDKKVVDLEKQLEEQRKVIADLQRAVQDSKKMDLKMENDEICSLRFEVCELEMKQRACEREVHKGYEALERSQSENLNLRRKLQTVGEDLRDLRVEFNRCLQNTAHFESDNLYLAHSLKSRETEIQVLQQQVQILEKDLENEQNRGEAQTAHDAKVITSLRQKVETLEAQLRRLENDYSEMLSNTEVKFLASKTHAAEQQHHLTVQNQDFAHTIRKLMYENENLHEEVHRHSVEEETLRNNLQREQKRQTENESKIEDLLNQVQDWEEKHRNLERDLNTKYEKSQKQFMKIIQELSKKSDEAKAREKQIYEKFQQREEEFDKLVVKNKMLKMELKEQESRDLSELNELESTMRLMHREMVGLKQRCASLAEELEKETSLRLRFETELGNQQSLVDKIRDYEQRVIPEMGADLKRHKNLIENLKIKVKEANASCRQMRQESLQLIQNTEFGSKKSSLGGGDFRRSEDQRLAVAVVEEPDNKNKTSDPWSPKPPAAHAVWQRQTRLSDSNEYFVESGFQSMLQSPVPTTPSYVNDYVEY